MRGDWMLKKLILWLYAYLNDIRGEFSLQPIDYSQIELPKEVLDSFASAMVPEIKKFYESDFGREYFNKWLEKQPEYA